jgi:hypothetical protein
MLLFFSRKESYVILDSVDNTRNEVRSILNRPWHDFSALMQGSYDQNDIFIIRPRFSFSMNRHLVMEGRVKAHNDHSLIEIRVRPKQGILALMYALLLWLVFELMKLEAPLSNNNLLLPLMLLILLIFFCFSLYRSARDFSKRFERVMNIS